MQEYICNKCECLFKIDKETVIKTRIKRRYIVCPACSTRNIKKTTNYKKLMEQRSGVPL